MDAAVSKTALPWSAHRVGIAAWSATLAVLAIAALVVLRRLTGAFDAPLAVGPLVATLLFASAILVASRVAVGFFAALRGRQRIALAWCGTFAVWLLCLGCAPPSMRYFAWLAWLPIVAIEHVSRVRFLDGAVHSTQGAADPSPAPSANPIVVSPDSDNEYIVQEIVRIRDANGVDAIRGTLVAEFAEGQRHATLYVGFCPRLDGAPTIEVELVDGPDASVKVTQAFAHGAAFELRLAEPAEETCRVALDFHAAAPASV
jgi:hypothetical protein